MNTREMKRSLKIGVLLSLSFVILVPLIFAEVEEDRGGGGIDPKKNIIAIHDDKSNQYNKNCMECHSDVLTGKSLDPSTRDVHVAMFEFAPGKPGDEKQCRWCHRTVDLAQGTQREEKWSGNLRKQVDAALCSLCHGPFERIVTYRKDPARAVKAKQFYQAGLSPSDPDGRSLYDLTCAACHKDLENSQVKGATPPKIQEAIDHDKGGMGVLTVLSAKEIDAIAYDALVP